MPAVDRVKSMVKSYRVWLALFLVGLGLFLRFWTYRSVPGAIDSDDAISALSSLGFLRGDFSVFFWGQSHGGSLASIVLAGFLAIVGPSTAAVVIFSVAEFAVSSLLVWRVGRYLVSESQAVFAAVIYFVFGPYVIVLSVHAHLFVWAAMIFGLLGMLFTLRLLKRTTKLDFALWGLCFGLGFWSSPSVLMFLIPCVVYALAKNYRLLKGGWIAALGFVIGSAPWIVYNLGHGWASLNVAAGAAPSSLAGRILGLFWFVIPQFLGLKKIGICIDIAHCRDIWGGWSVPILAPVAYVCIVFGFCWLMVRHFRHRELLFGTCLCFGVLYAISGFSFFVGTPRYMVTLAPVLVLLLASFAATKKQQFAVGCGVLVLTLSGLVAWNAIPGSDNPAAHDRQVIRDLEKLGVTRGYAPYWTAYKISLESKLKVILAPPPHDDRSSGRFVTQTVKSAGKPTTIVVLKSSPQESCAERTLRSKGIAHDRLETASVVVYMVPEVVESTLLDAALSSTSCPP